jgi:hypothetical protein
VLSRLFRRLFLERLTAVYQAGRLQFFADQAALAEPAVFKAHLGALRKVEWVVYAKPPFGGPDAVLAYLSRYTHRVAIANSRLVAFDGERVTFQWKDYRTKADPRYKLMTLDADEFMRRFLIHVLPDGFHRIRHYGLLANGNRTGDIALARRLLGIPDPARPAARAGTENRHEDDEWNACPCCGASSTRSLRRSHPGWPKPAPRWSLNRRPVWNRQIRSRSSGKFPHRSTPASVRTPPRFPPRGFSDACRRVAPRALAWQASENP